MRFFFKLHWYLSFLILLDWFKLILKKLFFDYCRDYFINIILEWYVIVVGYVNDREYIILSVCAALSLRAARATRTSRATRDMRATRAARSMRATRATLATRVSCTFG